ncbi:MAG: hypothetical protein QF926_06460 [Alphaproteobacteria bacterium]|jgi:hypothetical protein|nr:hypothetical protein [Alphaproteobacteria bacterium]MDP6516244.1 hypothetical protein [Alphaproteobacteria bacterium]|tara:strand:+ start:134 stop:574 length:441 start_codon:yes stop_codon:yes gene_type:complete
METQKIADGRSVIIETVEIEPVRVRVLPDARVDRRNAAKYLGRAEKTLAMWEMEGKGPKSIKVGGRRFYYIDVLDKFIRASAVLILTVLLNVIAVLLIVAARAGPMPSHDDVLGTLKVEECARQIVVHDRQLGCVDLPDIAEKALA